MAVMSMCCLTSRKSLNTSKVSAWIKNNENNLKNANQECHTDHTSPTWESYSAV